MSDAGLFLAPMQGEINMTTPRDPAFDQFEQVLARAGLRASLAHLVEKTDYRFIGIFRFENGRANAAVHYDRQNPAQLHAMEVSESATYCCYVRDSKGSFTTANALLDARLADHPAREAVLAYCGVPVMDPEGVLLGTLCHYDVVPRDPEQIDLHLMLQVASTIARRGLVPDYPRTA
jgi:GAF domain-containing protein